MNIETSNENWSVQKIGVIGPGIVGMPMAALLANAEIKIGTNDPLQVIVVQRNSKTSGWKVDAINSGKSVIGGIEPELDEIVNKCVNNGTLKASHNYESLSDADVILVCVQTDKKGLEPDYGPLFSSLQDLAEALQKKPVNKKPMIVFESTLAPSTMNTIIKDFFSKYGLIEGKDIYLGNSPNRVMPGRLVERISAADKLIGGLQQITVDRIKQIYTNIVKQGFLYTTNSFTAEIVKTLENAYRDVRIAFSAEIANYCDKNNIDFYELRDKVNLKLNQPDDASHNSNSIPVGGILIPTIGVGGHCLPKDGILLWWRKIESNGSTSNSLIMESRKINDESPATTIERAELNLGNLSGKKIALMGAAYRANSEDTRNSPTFELAKQLLNKNCTIKIHDPYVKETDQNLLKYNLQNYFTNDISYSIEDADFIIFCAAHQLYKEHENLFIQKENLIGIFDGCNLFDKNTFKESKFKYSGIGRGNTKPDNYFVEFVFESFRIVEKGFANEINDLVDFYNFKYANKGFDFIEFDTVQKLAVSCTTGCELVSPDNINTMPEYKGYSSRLAKKSYEAFLIKA